MKPLSFLLPPKHRSKTLSSSADFSAGLRVFCRLKPSLQAKANRRDTKFGKETAPNFNQIDSTKAIATHQLQGISSAERIFSRLPSSLQQAFFSSRGLVQRKDFSRLSPPHCNKPFSSCRGFDQRKKLLSRLSYQHTTSPSSAAGDSLSGKAFEAPSSSLQQAFLSNRGIV